MAITLTYGTLDLNDGTDYQLLEGFDPGEKVKTFTEYQSYSGDVDQYDVSEANLIEVTVPLKVMGTTLSDLHAHIDAINAKIDAGAQTLAYNDGSGAVNYSCVQSPRVHFVPDGIAISRFWTKVVLTLYRTP